VACGTGIAPIMSIIGCNDFINFLEYQNNKNILLFYGFRHSNKDFYYKEFLENLY
jgi:sulfite reductase alpha subunit-like flavoprotein